MINRNINQLSKPISNACLESGIRSWMWSPIMSNSVEFENMYTFVVLNRNRIKNKNKFYRFSSNAVNAVIIPVNDRTKTLVISERISI